MNETTDFRLMMVWIGLVVVTAISWFAGVSGASMQVNAGVTTIVLAISAVKARFILREFMEVNHASPALKRISDAWVLLTFLLLIGFYLFGSYFWKYVGDYFLH